MPPSTKRYLRDEDGRLCSPVEERFWAKVNKDGPVPGRCPELGRCWVWMGAKGGGPPPYGHFGLGPRRLGTMPAHRVAYELVVGRVPDGLVLDHQCRNRLCVNPDHLRPVTNRINVLIGEGASAINLQKTHCRKGHPLSGDNLKIEKLGRRCRQCKLEAQALRRGHKVPGTPRRVLDRCEVCGCFVGYYPVGFHCDTHCSQCTCTKCEPTDWRPVERRMPDFLQREREGYQRRTAQFSTAPEDPCLCRKGGDTGEDCPWKCPPYRPVERPVERPS